MKEKKWKEWFLKVKIIVKDLGFRCSNQDLKLKCFRTSFEWLYGNKNLRFWVWMGCMVNTHGWHYKYWYLAHF
jgi:hypothetical protein